MRGGASAAHDSVVAHSQIERGLCIEQLSITLSFTIRHQHQGDGEPHDVPSPAPVCRSMTSAALSPRVRRDNRYARYQAVRALQQQGFSLREISRRLEISRRTVRRFVRAESFPERSRPPQKASLLDPYKPYLLKRGPEGCWNGTQLYAELKAGGYTGSAPLLRRFITTLRKKQHVAGSAAPLKAMLDHPEKMDCDGGNVDGYICCLLRARYWRKQGAGMRWHYLFCSNLCSFICFL